MTFKPLNCPVAVPRQRPTPLKIEVSITQRVVTEAYILMIKALIYAA